MVAIKWIRVKNDTRAQKIIVLLEDIFRVRSVSVSSILSGPVASGLAPRKMLS